ncbi:MAG: cation:proton antiporter [Pseudomonadota bacterium]
MASPTVDPAIIKDTLIFLGAAGIVVPLLRRCRVPTILGFVLAGIVLGPYGIASLGSFWPDSQAVLKHVTITDPEAAAPLAELGVLFLLFLLGLELSFGKLWAMRRIVFGTGGAQSLFTALVIGVVAWAYGVSAQAAAVIGFALALSSTAIVMQLLIEKRKVTTPVGRTGLGVLLFQDILVAPILIMVGILAATSGEAANGGQAALGSILFNALVQGAVAIGAMLIIGRYMLRRVFSLAAQTGGRDFLMALTLLVVVGAAALTAVAELSIALGAFLAGILVGETEFKHQTEVDIEPFKGLLLGLFFMTVGMNLDLSFIAEQLPWVSLALITMILGKWLIAATSSWLFAGVSWPQAFHAGAMLAPAGEFAFVILGAAGATGLVAPEAAIFVAAVAGSSMVTIPGMALLGETLSKRFQAPQSPAMADDTNTGFDDLEGHVVIAGFGRVGHAFGHIMEKEEAPFVALDRNARTVSAARKEGWKTYLGDSSRPEILTKAGAHGAALFVVTVDDPASAEAMVRAMRTIRQDVPILARARDAEHAASLQAVGANFVIPDAIEAGLQLAGVALEHFGYDSETVRDRLAVERDLEYVSGTQPAEQTA